LICRSVDRECGNDVANSRAAPAVHISLTSDAQTRFIMGGNSRRCLAHPLYSRTPYRRIAYEAGRQTASAQRCIDDRTLFQRIDLASRVVNAVFGSWQGITCESERRRPSGITFAFSQANRVRNTNRNPPVHTKPPERKPDDASKSVGVASCPPPLARLQERISCSSWPGEWNPSGRGHRSVRSASP